MNSAQLIHSAREAAGLTQAELAERSGTSQATISSYERRTKAPTAETLERVLAAAGRRLVTAPATRPVRVPSMSELEERARILSQVLQLAEALPAKRERPLTYPRLPG